MALGEARRKTAQRRKNVLSKLEYGPAKKSDKSEKWEKNTSYIMQIKRLSRFLAFTKQRENIQNCEQGKKSITMSFHRSKIFIFL